MRGGGIVSCDVYLARDRSNDASSICYFSPKIRLMHLTEVVRAAFEYQLFMRSSLIYEIG